MYVRTKEQNIIRPISSKLVESPGELYNIISQANILGKYGIISIHLREINSQYLIEVPKKYGSSILYNIEIVDNEGRFFGEIMKNRIEGGRSKVVWVPNPAALLGCHVCTRWVKNSGDKRNNYPGDNEAPAKIYFIAINLRHCKPKILLHEEILNSRGNFKLSQLIANQFIGIKEK